MNAADIKACECIAQSFFNVGTKTDAGFALPYTMVMYGTVSAVIDRKGGRAGEHKTPAATKPLAENLPQHAQKLDLLDPSRNTKFKRRSAVPCGTPVDAGNHAQGHVLTIEAHLHMINLPHHDKEHCTVTL